MFYQVENGLKETEISKLQKNLLTVGYVKAEDLPRAAECLEIPEGVISRCIPCPDPFRSSVETYDEFTFATLRVAGDQPDSEDDRIGLFIRRNLLLIIDVMDLDGSTRNIFFEALKRFSGTSLTLEKIIVGFFDMLTAGDIQRIEDLNDTIHMLEGEIITDRIEDNFNEKILKNEEYILKLHYYYEHMLDIVQSLDENENDLISDGKMLYISNLTRRLERLREDTDSLKNTVEHLQDAYYSYLDTQMNKTMKVLTVLTTVFFPLTIIVGWYGMNFTTMPELTWKFGYIYVILLSVIVVALLWYIGRKNKWFK